MPRHFFSKEVVSSMLSKALVKRNEIPPDRYSLVHFMRRQDMNNWNCLPGSVEHMPWSLGMLLLFCLRLHPSKWCCYWFNFGQKLLDRDNNSHHIMQMKFISIVLEYILYSRILVLGNYLQLWKSPLCVLLPQPYCSKTH